MERDAAFEEAGVEDTSSARQSVYRTIHEAKDEAKAEAKWSSTRASVGNRGLWPS